jgi:N-acetylmuramoyl-L-alanine amidase
MMVCAPFGKLPLKPALKRVLRTVLLSALIAWGTTITAGTPVFARSLSLSAPARVEVRSVQLTPDGKALLLESDTPLREREARGVTVLRFPQPNRVLVDIPNARLAARKPSDIPVHRNGIDRIELTEISGDFYNAVRAIIYVNDADALARLTPTLSGNFLKLEEGAVTAMTGSPSAAASSVPASAARTVSLRPLGLSPVPGSPKSSKPSVDPSSNVAVKPAPKKSSSNQIVLRKLESPAQPLPPVASPLPVLRPLKTATFPTPNPQGPQSPNFGGGLPGPIGPVAGPVSPLMPSGPMTILGTPLMPGTSVIESVGFRDGRLMIQAHAGTKLHIKDRLLLKDPSRLVVDLDNAVLASRALLGTVTGDSSNRMRQVRVGQFDEKTVRLVIETPTPGAFEPVFNREGEANTLALVPVDLAPGNTGAPMSALGMLAHSRTGEVESIDLKREQGGTLLRLSASAPIAHRVHKKGERVVLDLLNEAAHTANIDVDRHQYPELDKMRLEAIEDGSASSKLSIVLADRNTRVLPMLSDGGKVLELLLLNNEGPNAVPERFSALASRQDDREDGGDSPVPADKVAVFAPAGPAPFPARIVVDAGHGGKDIGANRRGVNEKDLNLSLALMVKDALTAKGFKVYMTRSTDVFLPLPQITAITNQVRPDLFISIHHNASVNTAQHGIETYYFTPQSIPLARKVHQREINAVGVRDGGVKRARFYVIHHTDVPAILCEVGYVSNPAELDALQTQERKLDTARSIADGVVDYLKTRVSARAR